MNTLAADRVRREVRRLFGRLRSQGVETRAHQVELAASIASCTLTEEPLVAEAPTGTGKSLAYLVGTLAARSLGREGPIFISTATRILQDQLSIKDASLLIRGGLLRPGDVITIKGRARYLCPLLAESHSPHRGDPGRQTTIRAFIRQSSDREFKIQDLHRLFVEGGWSGDLDEAPTLPRDVHLVTAANTICAGEECSHVDVCPYYSSLRAIRKDSVVIANHAVMFRSLLRDDNDDYALTGLEIPAGATLVFDEAHRIADAGCSAKSRKVDPKDIRHLLRSLRRIGESLYDRRFTWGGPDTDHYMLCHSLAGRRWGRAIDDWVEQIGIFVPRVGDEGDNWVSASAIPEYTLEASAPVLELGWRYVRTLEDVARRVTEDPTGDERTVRFLKHASSTILGARRQVAECLVAVTEFCDTLAGCGRWVRLDEGDGRPVLEVRPLDVSELMRERVWDKFRSSTCVSATLRFEGSYERFCEEIGLSNPREVTIPPVLPYHRSRLVVPSSASDPRSDNWQETALRQIETSLLHARPGRGMLILVPSLKLLKEATVRFGHFEHLLPQGSRPKGALLEEHRRRIRRGNKSVLLGSASFAEGLDLPGDELVTLVILKIPFDAHKDPWVALRLDAAGAEGFRRISLPNAARVLQQAVGRLVRTPRDRGTIYLLDSRIRESAYGQKILRSLPPFRIIIERDSPGSG